MNWGRCWAILCHQIVLQNIVSKKEHVLLSPFEYSYISRTSIDLLSLFPLQFLSRIFIIIHFNLFAIKFKNLKVSICSFVQTITPLRCNETIQPDDI